jgi:hypothetical protein
MAALRRPAPPGASSAYQAVSACRYWCEAKMTTMGRPRVTTPSSQGLGVTCAVSCPPLRSTRSSSMSARADCAAPRCDDFGDVRVLIAQLEPDDV